MESHETNNSEFVLLKNYSEKWNALSLSDKLNKLTNFICLHKHDPSFISEVAQAKKLKLELSEEFLKSPEVKEKNNCETNSKTNSNYSFDAYQTKICNHCHIEKTAENFYIKKNQKLKEKCKECCREIKKTKYQSRKRLLKYQEFYDKLNITTQICNICHVDKVVSAFDFQRIKNGIPIYLRNQCRSCRHEKEKKW
jgi:hypothetical protein